MNKIMSLVMSLIFAIVLTMVVGFVIASIEGYEYDFGSAVPIGVVLGFIVYFFGAAITTSKTEEG
ncbi:DUF2929 family protein [Caldalkalibacillus salinus]|uniref:DUF2929 family protein n=1 Tax=Caldalkalibacillus salinus TaxID=2803787 RepID=UPI00192244E8|nr:DUF2929 family protein [Caldalkalibacillus salinus]